MTEEKNTKDVPWRLYSEGKYLFTEGIKLKLSQKISSSLVLTAVNLSRFLAQSELDPVCEYSLRLEVEVRKPKNTVLSTQRNHNCNLENIVTVFQ